MTAEIIDFLQQRRLYALRARVAEMQGHIDAIVALHGCGILSDDEARCRLDSTILELNRISENIGEAA